MVRTEADPFAMGCIEQESEGKGVDEVVKGKRRNMKRRKYPK